MIKKKVSWGEIYYCDITNSKGSVQSGKRPVLVVQTDKLNKSSPTAVVAVLTSVIKKEEMNTHVSLGEECGLSEPSLVLLEQLRTVDVNEELTDYIGKVTDTDKINEIKRGLKYEIGLPIKPRAERRGAVLSLCSNCRKELFKDKDHVLKRIDPFQSEQECCEKCHVGYGYDYFVMKRMRWSEKNKNED